MKAGWTRLLILAPLAMGAAAIGAAAPAFAQSLFLATQGGYRQAGTAQASKLTIQVEAALPDGHVLLLPDATACGKTCPGGALAFSVTNTGEVPLKVVAVAQTDGAKISSDRPTCAASASFAPPDLAARPWPLIPPHATLQVTGSDSYQLGLGLIHLAPNTPNDCQGATFTVPISVSAEAAV